ncbi:MAG: ABC transporter ATP-binding protein [Clostridia bacterium]
MSNTTENVKDTTKDIFKEKRSKLLLRMMRHAKPILGWLLCSGLISIISVTLGIIAPLFTRNITDQIFSFWADQVPFNWQAMTANCLYLATVYIFSNLAGVANMFIMNNVVSRFYTCGIRIEISAKIKRLPISYIDQTPNGEILSRLTSDVSHMGSTVHAVINLVIQGVIQIVGIAIMMFSINYILALVVMAIVPISLVISSILVNRSEKMYGKVRKTWGKLHAFIEEDYTGFDTIKAYNLEESQFNKLSTNCNIMRDDMKTANIISSRVQPIIGFTNNIAFVIICVLGGYLAINKQISVGEVVAIIAYAKLFASPLESLAQSVNMLQQSFASARRVYDLLDRTEMDAPTSQAVPSGKGAVEFKNVCFSYDKTKPLLTNLNLSVKPGQKVAIVGPTGGGKTTIVNLLMRFYDCDSGQILIDGVDTRTISREQVRQLFAMVLQDTWLYSGTIYDNIAYANTKATREEVIKAAGCAHIDHFIDTLPQGYDTLINEESTNISSGQKQLLTIARAYLADRKMLILDEATSNVDTRTELLIQQTMDNLSNGKTSFVIAHRLSTIVDADIILVVNNGQIVETGTHDELMEKNGFYSEIYNSQYDLLK